MRVCIEQLLAKGPFKEDYALAIFAQVAIAVDYMHGLDVVHRDLKVLDDLCVMPARLPSLAHASHMHMHVCVLDSSRPRGVRRERPPSRLTRLSPPHAPHAPHAPWARVTVRLLPSALPHTRQPSPTRSDARRGRTHMSWTVVCACVHMVLCDLNHSIHHLSRPISQKPRFYCFYSLRC